MEAVATDLERSLARLLIEAAGARRRLITRELLRVAGARCAAGPFRGMLLPETSSWGDGDLAPEILGAYECELHAALERAFARAPERVVNVGCAEGYYAVGAALRLPGATVHAFDLDEAALRVCGEIARRNGVADRIRLERRCDPARLLDLLRTCPRALLLLDCEGYERELITPETVPALAGADLIVECHDFLEPGLTDRLAALLRPTHEVELVREGSRDPAAWPILHGPGSLDRRLVVCEFRPSPMRWIVARSRADGAAAAAPGDTAR